LALQTQHINDVTIASQHFETTHSTDCARISTLKLKTSRIHTNTSILRPDKFKSEI